MRARKAAEVHQREAVVICEMVKWDRIGVHVLHVWRLTLLDERVACKAGMCRASGSPMRWASR